VILLTALNLRDRLPERSTEARPPPRRTIDRVLADELWLDGRATISHLARCANLSESATCRRVARLLHTGTVTIQMFEHPVLRGLPVTGHLLITLEGAADQFAGRLVHLPNVRRTDILTGPYSLAVETRTATDAGLTALVDQVRTMRGLRGVHIARVTHAALDGYLPVRFTPVVPDLIDERIIAALTADGRAPYTRLLPGGGLRTNAIRRRTRRLLSTGMITVRGLSQPDPAQEITGFGLSTTTSRATIADLKRHPGIHELAACTGGPYDVIGRIITDEHRHLLDRLSATLGVTAATTWSIHHTQIRAPHIQNEPSPAARPDSGIRPVVAVTGKPPPEYPSYR
jgi:DNA-binding Lrp family transcriptional regulator